MKKILLLFAILLLNISCQNKKENQENNSSEVRKENKKLVNKKKETNEYNLTEIHRENQKLMNSKIDFSLDAKPEYFAAKTIDGNLFTTQDFKNKNIVIFIYDKSYLKKSETYDMTEEFNIIYYSYKDKIKFLGIIEGYDKNENELHEYIKNSQISFEQIDNTETQNKSKILDYKMFCSPAKILIDTNGKVIHSSCGGGNSNELVQKLDSIKNYR